MERVIVDWDNVEQQEAAADVLLQRAISEKQVPEDSLVAIVKDGIVTAKILGTTYYLGHISEGLSLLEEILNQS